MEPERSLSTTPTPLFKLQRDDPITIEAIDADKMWRDCSRKLLLFREMVTIALSTADFPMDITVLIFNILVRRWSFLGTTGFFSHTTYPGNFREVVFRYVITTPYLWSTQRNVVPCQPQSLVALMLAQMTELLIQFLFNKWGNDSRVISIEPNRPSDTAFRCPYLRTTGQVSSVHRTVVQVSPAASNAGQLPLQWRKDLHEATLLCDNPDARVVFM